MKTLRTLFVAAVTAAALVSCSKEVNTDDQSSNKKDFSFKFFANVENVGTRATLTPNANETSFAAAWEDEDSMDLSASSIDAEFDESGYAVWSEQDQAFNAVFGGIDVPTGEYEWLYYGYYPAKESIPFGSPREQQGNAYNSLYDVMYGETDAITAEFGKDANGDPLVIPMSRLTGIAYFHITGGPEEDVISATLSAEGIAAEVVNIECVESVPAVTVSNETPRYDEITINFAQGTAPQATDLQLWFNVLPGQYQNLKLTIVTENHIAVLAPTATFNYVAGKLNKAVLNQLNWQSFEKAPKGTVLLSETFDGFVADDEPEVPGSGATVYGNANVTYSCTEGTKIYTTQISAGGSSPELLVKGGGEFAITGVPTGYNTTLTVYWNSNNTNIKLNYAGETTTGTLVPGTTKHYMALVTVPAGTASVNLGFKNTTTNNGRLDNIQITAGVSNAPAGLSYTVTEFEAVLGDAFEAPELKNPNTLPVTYASSDADVAEVDAATGAVTIKALGEATITASSEATDDFEAGEASYVITVVPATLTLSEGTTPAKATCAEDATVTFTVTSNIAWTAAVDTDGDVNDIVKSVTAEDDVVTVTFNRNEDIVDKTAVIAVTPTNNVHSALKKTITVTQEAFKNTDVLTYEWTGVSGSGYKNWSGKEGTVSDAVYAGNSNAATNINYIQLRNTSPSGIVSTTSGGVVRKVEIVWANNTTAGRTITVYGSNDAYTGPSDLYNSSKCGKALGTIVMGTSTVLEINDDYAYVGLLANGALYADEIDITWGTADPNRPRFDAEIVGDADIEADVTTGTVQVTGNVAWTATATNGATLSPASGTGEATITVTMPENESYTESASYVVTVSTEAEVSQKSFALTFTQAPAVDPNQNDGSLEKPYTVAEALAILAGYSSGQLSSDWYYVSGTISRVDSYSSKYSSITYFISDDGTQNNELEVYSGKNIGNTDFSSIDDLSVGDEVIVYGQFKDYSGTKEIYQNNYLYSRNGITKVLSSIAVSGQKTSFDKDEAFSFGGTVTATYTDNSSADVTASATFSGYNMSISGNQIVTVSYTEGGITKTTTYQITVSSPDEPDPVEKEYSFAFSVIGTTGWTSSFADHTVYNDDVATITLYQSNKQTQTITEYPVTKAGDVVVILKDGTFSAVTFSLTQWTTKSKTVSLQYSTDGGSTFKALSPAVSSSTFTLSSSNLPAGTNAVKMVQGNTSNQVGLTGVSFTYIPSN